ncbi:MAG: hypothetical protein DCF20_10910 [Pseudanabaena sp.]|nr:MAG: hypothetical protein DCF20_10910 [Pseudanabaena sp.]
MSFQRIFALLLIVFGTASLIFAMTNIPYSPFAAMMFGVSGVVMIAIAVLSYRATSMLDGTRAVVSWMLILAGIPSSAFSLFVMLMGGDIYMIIMLYGLPGLAAGTLGWTLLKPKFPIVMAKKIISGICITTGAGAVLFPIVILSILGTTIGFVSIAPIYVMSGIGLVAIGSQLRRPTKAKQK